MPHSALIHSLPPLGFIAVDVHFHRPPGDPFNALTWPFPLIKEQAEGSKLGQIVTKDSYPEDFLNRFVEAGHGQRLASKGCVGIITSCGFLAIAQPVLASRLPIPVATSAMIQIPSIRSFLPPQKSIGVITYDGTRLGPLHLSQLGISAEGIYIVGAPDDGYLRGVIRDGREYVHDEIEAELVRCAKELVEAHSDVGAIVLECTQMPPFAMAIQQAVGLPVHDVYTMGKWFYSGLVRRDEWST